MKHKRRTNKKGQLQDIAYFMVLIFSLVLMIIFARIILNKFNDALEDGGMQTTESREALVNMNVAFPTFDNAILMIVILLSIGLIITSFFIPTHPIFLFINIFGIFFLCLLGMLLSNMYREMILESPEMAEVYGDFTKINFIMNKLPWIAAILIFIVTIIQYSKFHSGG